MRKTIFFIMAIVVVATTLTLTASPVVGKAEAGVMTESAAPKKQMKPEEILAQMKDLSGGWKKPQRTGSDLDEYYQVADTFFRMIREIDVEVPIFKVAKVVSPKNEPIIAPVELHTGTIRHRGEAVGQSLKAVPYGIKLAGLSARLVLLTTANGPQIAADAIPFVGNKERKAANVQIAKGTKAFPLLKKLMDSQRGIMNKYFKENSNISWNDSVSKQLEREDIDFSTALEMTDEELEEYLKKETGN